MCDDPKQGRAARGVSRAGDVLVRIPFVHMARAGSVRFGSQSRRSCAFARYRMWRYRITLPYRRCRRAPAPYRPDQFTATSLRPVRTRRCIVRFIAVHASWLGGTASQQERGRPDRKRSAPTNAPWGDHGGDPTLTRCVPVSPTDTAHTSAVRLTGVAVQRNQPDGITPH